LLIFFVLSFHILSIKKRADFKKKKKNNPIKMGLFWR